MHADSTVSHMKCGKDNLQACSIIEELEYDVAVADSTSCACVPECGC